MAVDKLKDVSFTEWLKLENAKDPDNTLPPELDFEKAIYKESKCESLAPLGTKMKHF